MKYAVRWMNSKGLALPEEERNPVEAQLDSFFDGCRTGGRPRAGLEVGLANSVAVILANIALERGSRVHFSEFQKMGGSRKG